MPISAQVSTKCWRWGIVVSQKDSPPPLPVGSVPCENVRGVGACSRSDRAQQPSYSCLVFVFSLFRTQNSTSLLYCLL